MEFGKIKKLKLIGEGSEAKVYQDGDNALKIYNGYKMKSADFQNKMNKILLLSELNLENFLLPKDLIFTKKLKFVGYSMDKINSKYDMKDLMESNKISLDTKIEKLKQLENNIKEAHKNNIVLIDGNFWNFLLYDDLVFMADTDSYKVKQFKEDFLPPFFCNYYQKKVNGELDSNLDKFQFGINILSYLTDGLFDRSQMIEYPNNDYLEKYIESLDMPKEIKEFFQELTSSSKEKMYIDNNLDNLSSSKCFVKKMNKKR